MEGVGSLGGSIVSISFWVVSLLVVPLLLSKCDDEQRRWSEPVKDIEFIWACLLDIQTRVNLSCMGNMIALKKISTYIPGGNNSINT